MRKCYSLVLILFVFLSIAKGQNEYYDAVKLSSYIKGGKFDTAKAAMNSYAPILKQYCVGETIEDVPSLFYAYKGNLFIKGFIPQLGQGASSRVKINELFTTTVGKVGGLDVTNFADGMAKFLVARAKQELSSAYFEKFKETLDKNKDLQIIFPKTYKVLMVVGSEIYNFQIYINMLREAFEYDLTTILSNGRKFVMEGNTMEKIRQDSAIYATIQLSFDLVESIKAGVHPGDAIASLASKEYASWIGEDFVSMLKVYRVFSNSMRSQDPDRYWISTEEFKKLEDVTIFKLYLGLVYQGFSENILVSVKKDKKESYKDGVLGKIADDPLKKFPVLKKLQESFKRVESSIAALKEKDKSARGMDYYNLYDSMLELIDVSFRDMRLDMVLPVVPYEGFKFYTNITGEIYLDVLQKKYSMAIMNTSIMVDSLTKDKKLSEAVLKYGSFMAAMSQAENSDQVQQAIEAVALPSGSSRIKRESLCNISINAYLGFYGGGEYIQKLKQGNLKGSVGLSAPIGIAFSKGSKSGWSGSFFISLIDLGAIASFRIKDSTTAALPQLKLQNILAPGAYLIAGIPKSPISFGVFGQYGPALRSVSATNVSVSNYNETTWRVGGMIAVDIPLLNLYNKGR